ncbi:MAG: phosphoribosylformylglycinamidine cyclo-ligase [Deltaproteobacteria bacterium]|nr:phosphoribosylformylglycinamidine cyclo-ligase [Deltaproteobacteria bacterium]
MTLSYKDAGVDINAADDFVERIARLAKTTHNQAVFSHHSKYAGLIRLDVNGMQEPLLAATCDGVGTKLLIAKMANSFEGLGQDLVAMSVNDLLPLGARPLLFLDYMAVGKLDASTMEAIVASIANACRECGCVLLGGETAEMPGLYAPGDFDLAGFAVGTVDKACLPKPELMQAGDVILALPSSGIHSNGISLARAALFERGQLGIDTKPVSLGGKTLAQELLTPTALYVQPVLRLFNKYNFHAAAHITGGGLLLRGKKLARQGLRLNIDPQTYQIHPIFKLIGDTGNVSPAELASTFNMGLGFVAIFAAKTAKQVLAEFSNDGWLEVGRVNSGKAGIDLGFASADLEE